MSWPSECRPAAHRVKTQPPATTAGAPSQQRPSAAPIATVALPAGQHRLRQEGLPRVPANPRTQTYLHTHRDTAHTHMTSDQSLPSPCIAGGLQGGQPFLPSPPCGEGPGVRPAFPSPGACSGGGLGRGQRLAHPTTHQVHPAIQVPPQPRPCSTAATGFYTPAPLPRPTLAHPPKTYLDPAIPLSPGERAGVRAAHPRPPASRGDHRGARLSSPCPPTPPPVTAGHIVPPTGFRKLKADR